MNWALLLGALFVGSTGADMASTMYVMRRCPDCVELNPLMAPLARRPALLVPAVGTSTVIVVISTREIRERHKWWWVPMAALTAAHVVFTVSNMRRAQ